MLQSSENGQKVIDEGSNSTWHVQPAASRGDDWRKIEEDFTLSALSPASCFLIWKKNRLWSGGRGKRRKLRVATRHGKIYKERDAHNTKVWFRFSWILTWIMVVCKENKQTNKERKTTVEYTGRHFNLDCALFMYCNFDLILCAPARWQDVSNS